MREAEIERQIVAYAHRRGFISLKLNVRGQRGWPDRMFLKWGRVLFMEIKTAEGELSPMQLMQIRRLALKANFAVNVVHNVEAGKIILDVWEEQVKRGKV